MADEDFTKLNERNISNSEVTAFLTCKRMYEFAFGMELTPKETSVPLARGTLGHLAFENYVRARLNSSNHQQAMKAVTDTFPQAMREGVTVDVAMETKLLVERYMAHHQGWPELRLLGTEERVDLKVTDDFTIPIRYDVLAEEISTGRVLVGDYKFTYDFWQPSDHDLNVQMPKYIAVMRANGMAVDGGFLEEIRTRPLGAEKSADPKNLWRRTKYFPGPMRLRNAMKQHIQASFEIVEHRAKSPEQRMEDATPVFNKHGACKYCNFKDLCNSMMDGVTDLGLMISTGYTENTYGYNKTESVEL